MTTVVFDGKILATDSQTTMQRHSTKAEHCPSCGVKHSKTHRFGNKIQLPKPAIGEDSKRRMPQFKGSDIVAWSGAGDKGMINAVSYCLGIEMELEHLGKTIWHLNREDASGTPLRKMGCTMIVVTQATTWKIEFSNSVHTLTEVTVFPVVAGSGGLAAKLAIERFGKDAVQALACAISVDEHTGGAINYYDCRAEVLVGKTTTVETHNLDTLIEPPKPEPVKKTRAPKKTKGAKS